MTKRLISFKYQKDSSQRGCSGNGKLAPVSVVGIAFKLNKNMLWWRYAVSSGINESALFDFKRRNVLEEQANCDVLS